MKFKSLGTAKSLVAVIVGLGSLTLPLFAGTASAASPYTATAVLGQAGFTSGGQDSGGSLGAVGFASPHGVAIDTVNHRLFVVDTNNNRVLVYNLDSSDNISSQTAVHVLGQANFTTSTADAAGFGSPTQNDLSGPNGITYDAANNYLFVADEGNHRVLVYNVATITDGMNASYVIGQTGFGAFVAADTQAGMKTPTGMAYDAAGHNLYVADNTDSRVLVYNISAIATGMNASYVLGQADYTHGSSAVTQTGLGNPNDVVFDPNNSRVYVDDTGNNRIMVYNAAALATGMNASYVLGAVDFTHTGSGDTATTFINSFGLTYDTTNNVLYVSDSGNGRVLGFNTTHIANNMAATSVLGQASFTTNGNSLTQTGMFGPNMSAFDPVYNRLFLADSTYNRVEQFNFVRVTTAAGAMAGANVGSAYDQTLASTGGQGSTTYAVTSGSLPTGLTLNASTGVISGTPTAMGTYNFEVTVTDSNGTSGTFFQDPAYSITVGAGAPDTGVIGGASNSLGSLFVLALIAALLTAGGAMLRRRSSF